MSAISTGYVESGSTLSVLKVDINAFFNQALDYLSKVVFKGLLLQFFEQILRSGLASSNMSTTV